MVSYAQNLEDVMLDRVLEDVDQGFYVDVGANDPTVMSITRHFYNHGWRGINIEPGTIFSRLQEARPRDINLNVAASDSYGERPFYEYPIIHAYSSLHDRQPDIAEEYQAGRWVRQVPVRTLRDIFEEFQPPCIDFMSVDVESHERQVLLGNDWSRWRPRVVLIESTLMGHARPGQHLWEDVILDAGYLFTYHDGLNRYYVRQEDVALRERFSTPPNCFDMYVLAEVISLREDLAQRDELCRQAEALADRLDEELKLARTTVERLTCELDARERFWMGAGRRSRQVGGWVARLAYLMAQSVRAVAACLTPRRNEPPALPARAAHRKLVPQSATSCTPGRHSGDGLCRSRPRTGVVLAGPPQ
jgi:FkbM family methyltransferase